MYAILARGGLRQISRRQPSVKPPQPQPWISALEAKRLILAGQAWDNMSVQGGLNLEQQSTLTELPFGLRCSSLNVSRCVNLTALPEHLDTTWLDISGCPQLSQLPAQTHSLTAIEMAGSGLSSLPPGLRVRLLWNGVAISEKMAFYPDTLTGQDVLQEDNAEIRRIMLERLGYKRFIDDVGGLVVDKDMDAGGQRKLIRVPMDDDEDILVLSVICPSTAHAYILRVPPYMRSCHQAAAWLAGFDNPNDYQPVIER